MPIEGNLLMCPCVRHPAAYVFVVETCKIASVCVMLSWHDAMRRAFSGSC